MWAKHKEGILGQPVSALEAAFLTGPQDKARVSFRIAAVLHTAWLAYVAVPPWQKPHVAARRHAATSLLRVSTSISIE